MRPGKIENSLPRGFQAQRGGGGMLSEQKIRWCPSITLMAFVIHN
jgi:hypothetical protein